MPTDPTPQVDVGQFDRVESSSAPEAFAEWMAHQRRHGPDRALELLDLDEGSSVLDIGCGTGTDLVRLGAAAGYAVGLDRSFTMAGTSLDGSRSSAIGVVNADGSALPFPESSFDACWARAVLIHTPSPQSVLEEIARVVRPGGRIVLSEPDHGTHVVACSCPEVFDRIRTHRQERFRSPHVGRHLADLASGAGLEVSTAWATPIVHRSLATAVASGGPFGLAVEAAVAGGAITADEAMSYEASLAELDDRGGFMFVAVAVSVLAVAPSGPA